MKYVRTHPQIYTTCLILIALFGALLDVRVASAHVSISPSVVRPNVYQAFVVDVPTEKQVPTISVKVEIPEGLTVARFQPAPGWNRVVEKDSAGRIIAVTWSGGEIASDEYMQFVFLARTPREPTTLIFKAYQTYEGGEIVNWTGAETDNFPASYVVVSDEAPAENDTAAPSIEDPETTTAPSDEAPPVATVEAAPAATEAPTVIVPSPTPFPSPTPPAPPTATAQVAGGVATPGVTVDADTGTDLGLLVALAALVVAMLGLALAAVAVVRGRRAP